MIPTFELIIALHRINYIYAKLGLHLSYYIIDNIMIGSLEEFIG